MNKKNVPPCFLYFSGRDGEKKNWKKKMEKNKKIPALRHRGHTLTICNVAPPAKSKMVTRGPQNGRRVLKRGLTLGYWALLHSLEVT